MSVICEPLDDPSLTARLGARLRADIAAWDWVHQAEHYARLFDSVLPAPDRAPERRSPWRFLRYARRPVTP